MSDLLTYPGVQEFLTTLVPPRPEEMVIMERYAQEHDFPIIGPAAGYMCYQVARLIGARSIFELGSGYGYSTAWFARAVQENTAADGRSGGKVHHVVWDEKLSAMAKDHLARLGFDGLIEYHVAEAVETLKGMPGKLDLIFNDINKEGYPASLPVIKEKLRPGGVLLTDNILWSGRIFDAKDTSASTQGVRDFTRLITEDPDWIVSVLPVRDGVMLALKK
ncbi:MAG TPA: O-methyltransferase [Anaerolineales bacterium]